MGLSLVYEYGQTALDEDEKEGLKIKSITTQKELNEFEQLNIEKALQWIIRTKPKLEKIMSEEFMKELHKRMYNDIWKWAGEFRKTEKNIGIQWSKISVELRTLIDDTLFWIENKTFSHTEIAIRFKHRIVSIHCFPNGNGRHSRLIADIIIESIFRQPLFTWHQSSRMKPDEIRKNYITALREADNGNINPLIEFAQG